MAKVYPEYDELSSQQPEKYPGFILRHGEPVPVRIASRGTLVAADLGTHSGMECYGLPEDREAWPQIYPTEELAWAAQDERSKSCHHHWTRLSHEERRCSRCGEVEFIPDL